MSLFMKKRITLCLALLLVTNIGYAELKIGYVDLKSVFANTPQAEQIKIRLQEEFAPRIKRLESQDKEIQRLKTQLSRDTAVMSESEQHKLERDITIKTRNAKRYRQDLQEDSDIRGNEEYEILKQSIRDVINVLIADEGFDLLLTQGVFHANKQINITQQVQDKLIAMSN